MSGWPGPVGQPTGRRCNELSLLSRWSEINVGQVLWKCNLLLVRNRVLKGEECRVCPLSFCQASLLSMVPSCIEKMLSQVTCSTFRPLLLSLSLLLFFCLIMFTMTFKLTLRNNVIAVFSDRRIVCFNWVLWLQVKSLFY